MTGSSRRPRSLLLLAALAIGVGASACSDDDAGESLASFMGWEAEDPDVAQARWQEQERQIQERIRECMAEQGFEYEPMDPGSTFSSVDDWDEEEWVRTRGFGITTWYGNEEEETVDAWEDPNQERIEAMSDVERQAYYDALHGSDEEMREVAEIEIDPETGEEIGFSMSGFGLGCEGQAREEIYGGQDTQALWDELQPAFEELYERVQADPRFLQMQEDWAECMADAGHQYRSQEDMHEAIYEDFDQRVQAIMSEAEYIDPFDGLSDEELEEIHANSSPAELDALYEEAHRRQLETIDRAALDALQQEEIDLAVADFECRGGEDSWERYQEISASYEAEFIAEHRELLEQIREAENR